MRKKLILAENANLFAETERKQIENETLKIKLEEEKVKCKDLSKENEKLMSKISELLLEIKEKDEKIHILANSPKKMDILEKKEGTSETPNLAEEVKAEPEENGQTVLETDSKEEKSSEITAEDRKILMEKGAAAISEVTRVVAGVYTRCEDLSAEEAEKIYSLALGKNETFKIKVSNLLVEKGEVQALLILLEEMTRDAKKQIEELI